MREHLHLPENLNGMVWRYRDPGRSNVRHHHAELELNQITRGSGTYLLANRRYRVRSGDLLWLFPAQEHVLIDQTADFEMWVAVFKRKAIRRIKRDPAAPLLLETDPPGVSCRRLAKPEHTRLDAALAELSTTAARPALFNAGLSYLLLNAWRCFESAAEIPVDDVHPAVERAARLIREGGTALSLDQVAARSGLSSARLSRLFREQTGLAMVSFRNRQRISSFLQIYGTGQRHTMLDAALEAGFGSYAQFHRVFKGALGCSPAAYRRGQTER
jgi:AraC-like DNA-binding protein/quercetin dioxygenase-like cupin family protein